MDNNEKQVALMHLSNGEYSIKQSIDARPMTAGELRRHLEECFEDNAPVVVHFGGYGVKYFAVKRVEDDYLYEYIDEESKNDDL